jgi:hypothetical protein
MKTFKHMLIGATYLLLGWLSVGCGHAQVKPTSYRVDLSWTAPVAAGGWTGCTTAAPCTYVASRITLASGTTTCPAANVTTLNYSPLNASLPATGTSYADTAASGLTVCYLVQTEQGSAVSNPSNLAGPFLVPSSPLAPSLSGNQTVAEAKPYHVPGAALYGQAPALTAKLTPVR